MFISLRKLFDIDDLGNGRRSRLLFASVLLLRWLAFFFPLGDPEFPWLEAYAESLLSSTGEIPSSEAITITTQNIVYILFLLAVNFVCFCACLLYAGLYIRERRLSNKDYPLYPISEGKLIWRVIFMVIVGFLLAIPGTILLPFMFFFILLGIPFVAVFIGGYLSGDFKFFDSMAVCPRKLRGRYFETIRILCTVGFFCFLLELLISVLLRGSSLTGFYVVESFLSSFELLLAGRAIGVVYCNVERSGLRRKDVMNKVNEAPKQ